ncbi:hypothetical protein [Amorphus orientalis]|uniref:Uncharacterized protein n=1 Tax=Amorphus orientalis TaxID=649198 RepID=A0AAE4AS87_9HYPH|nr:hypothetical protein [Amorphus orientalis]MDQ0314847.1 hypothetical protein [Amorphus orientalis]
MSFVRMGLRIAAVEAVKGATLIGDRVLDSEIAALSTDANGAIRTDQEKPFISIYTDDGEMVLDSGAPGGLHENGTIDLVFEMGIAASMTVRNPETGESEVLTGVPATDRAFEVHADLVCRQIADALADRTNPWAEVFRGLRARVLKVRRARANSTEHAARLAAAQLKVTVELIDDPALGVPIDPDLPFGRLLALMETSEDPVLSPTAALIRAHLAGYREPWRVVQEQSGLGSRELAALGLGPIDWTLGDDDELPTGQSATIEMAGRAGVDVSADPEGE